MKNKNFFRIVFFTLFLLFIVLYITQSLGYYEYNNRKTNTMTEDAVKRFEEDIKSGKTIKASDYIKKDNDYNNNMSRFGLKLSNSVGNVFDGIMNFIFYELNKTVSN